MKSVSTVLLRATLLMYGDSFIKMKRSNDKNSIDTISIADGGVIVNKDEYQYPDNTFCEIVEAIFNLTFPDDQNECDSLLWEMKCFDENNNEIDGLELGTWGRDTLKGILLRIVNILESDIFLHRIC